MGLLRRLNEIIYGKFLTQYLAHGKYPLSYHHHYKYNIIISIS